MAGRGQLALALTFLMFAFENVLRLLLAISGVLEFRWSFHAFMEWWPSYVDLTSPLFVVVWFSLFWLFWRQIEWKR
jgi:hypothetical protein